MKNEALCLIEGYELPGLGVLPEYTIIATVAATEIETLNEKIKHNRQFNRITGETGYTYQILPQTETHEYVTEKNEYRSFQLSEFRHKVYGEPKPV